jgi:hypothetical protein
MASQRLDPIDGVLPAAVAPVRPVLLTPAEREAERRRRERARAQREASEPVDRPPDEAPRPRLDVRG